MLPENKLVRCFQECPTLATVQSAKHAILTIQSLAAHVHHDTLHSKLLMQEHIHSKPNSGYSVPHMADVVVYVSKFI
jgi:hypothetical protein